MRTLPIVVSVGPILTPACETPRPLLRGGGAELEIDRLGLAARHRDGGLLDAELLVPRLELVGASVEPGDRELAVGLRSTEKIRMR